MTRGVRTLLLLLAIALCPDRPALAWKLETHLWLASKLVSELRSSACNVTIAPFGNLPVRKNVCDAILANEGAFLLGVLGADVYPDMVAGQFTTHPGVERSEKAIAFARTTTQQFGRTFTVPRLWKTDDWLDYVRRQAQSPAEIAFAHGYMIHAAMDMWAHTYVNIYSGGVFSLMDEQEVEFRHMALESFIKHTHKSFLPSAAAGRAVTRRSENDALTPLTAPIAFVRDKLVLNADVAQQYAMQEQTLHLWFMYTYWNEVRNLPSRIQPVLNGVSSAIKALESNAAFKTAQAAHQDAQRKHKDAQEFYNSQLAQFGANNPAATAAKAALDTASNELRKAIDAFEPHKLARQALDNIGREVQNLAKGPIDQWRQHLERAVDAYILAWQDTSKELMRPKPTILTPGSEPTYPLTRWATCWGSTFGLPVSSLSAQCAASLSGYKALNDTLQAWLKDTLIKEPLRKEIEAFAKTVDKIGVELVIASGQAFSSHFRDQGVVAGYTQSIVALRSKEAPTPAALDDEFDDNTSNKRLVTYTQVKFSDLVLADMGLKGMPDDPLDLPAFRDFAALQNSMTMSKLTLLGGAELNVLVARAMNSAAATRPIAGMPTARDPSAVPPLYSPSDPPGIVLIGAVRSIDGDHQWQRVAPALPPAVGVIGPAGSAPDALRDRSSSYGRTVTVPGPCRVFGYGATDAGKGGLRLWQNPATRRAVFNHIFLGPLTPGLLANSKALGLVLSQGLAGMAGPDGAYPATLATGCGGGS